MATRVLPFWSPKFARAYVITMRPYLLFVSGAAGLVGLSFIPDLTYGRILLAFVPLFLSYGFGQALTDCFQTDTDSLSAPYRPLVQGIVTRRQILTVSMIGLTAVVLVLAYLNPAILIIGIVILITQGKKLVKYGMQKVKEPIMQALPADIDRAEAELITDAHWPELLDEFLLLKKERKPLNDRYDELDEMIKKRFEGVPKALVDDFMVTGKWIDRKAFTVEAKRSWRKNIIRIESGTMSEGQLKKTKGAKKL